MKPTIAVILGVVCFGFYVAKYAIERVHSEHIITRRPSVQVSKVGMRSQSLRKYHLGFGNLLADLIWIHLLQEATHEKLPPGTVSWEFIQLDSITTLDPKFNTAYSFGASFLSVFRQDKIGAKILLEKWVKHRSQNWQPHFLLGYHLYYEMGEKAARSY